jgi:DNA-directed RNA polymerase specialized sigma24 family protein
MTAREYLSRYLDAIKMVQAKSEQITSLRCIATKATTTYSGAPRSAGVQDRIGNIVAHIVDLSREVDGETEQLDIIRGEVETAIGAVEDKTLRDLLTCRYILGWKWEDVAKSIDRTVDMTKIKLHIRALDAVQNNLNHNMWD